MSLIVSIIVVLIVLALVLWAINYLPAPPTIKMLLNVLVIILAVVYILSHAGIVAL